MATVPQKTLNWLWDVLRREYRDPQRAYTDLAQSIALFPGLAPRTDVYTSENGAPALLLHLNGTLPVNFRGSQYRFPIAVWIPHAYPYEPPILYVTPSDDIVIRPGQHVSGSDGKIYHPYLARWREAWDRSTIAEFLKLLVDIFAREPPVMSKQQSMQQPQGPISGQQPPPRPPPPTEQRPLSARSLSVAGGPPPPPPKNNEQFGAVPGSTASPGPSRAGRYDAPPPLPGQSARPQSMVSPPPPPPLPNQYQPPYQPPRQDGFRQSFPNQQQPPAPPGQYSQRQSIAGPPMPTPNQPIQSNHRQPPPNQSYSQNIGPPQQQGQYVQQQPQPSYQGPPPPQPQQRQQQPAPQPQPMAPPPQQQPYMVPQQSVPQPPKPKTPQPNLMDDSPFDIALPTTNANLPTPAIPPNPAKQHILQTLSSTLLITLQNQITQSSAALGPLQSQYIALQSAEKTLQSEIAHLKALQGQLSQNVASLDTTIKAADRTISSTQSSSTADKTSVDDMVIPPTVVARQLYDAVAEQRGYEAAIYALTEGFVRGRIGSDLWARKMRECAREDFRRKYLVKKRVGVGMGLDVSQMGMGE